MVQDLSADSFLLGMAHDPQFSEAIVQWQCAKQLELEMKGRFSQSLSIAFANHAGRLRCSGTGGLRFATVVMSKGNSDAVKLLLRDRVPGGLLCGTTTVLSVLARSSILQSSVADARLVGLVGTREMTERGSRCDWKILGPGKFVLGKASRRYGHDCARGYKHAFLFRDGEP